MPVMQDAYTEAMDPTLLTRHQWVFLSHQRCGQACPSKQVSSMSASKVVASAPLRVPARHLQHLGRGISGYSLHPITARASKLMWSDTEILLICARSDQVYVLTSPVNSRVVFLLSMPDVPSKTCTTARLPSTSSTWPRRAVPSPSLMLTISA